MMKRLTVFLGLLLIAALVSVPVFAQDFGRGGRHRGLQIDPEWMGLDEQTLEEVKTVRTKFLKALGARSESLVFYESPKRIISLLQDIIACMGDRYAMLAREMTKLHEEFVRGTVSQILSVVSSRSTVKGECTLLVAGRDPSDEMDIQSLKAAIEAALENEIGSLSEISRTIAQEFGFPKKTVYDLALQIRGRRPRLRSVELRRGKQRTED